MNDFLRLLFCAIPSFVAFWCFFTFLLRWSDLTRTQRAFAWMLIFLSLGTTCCYLFQFPIFQKAHRIDWFLSACMAFLPALYYSFLCRLTDTVDQTKVFGAFSVPTVIVFVDMVLYMMLGDPDAGEYLSQVSLAESFEFSTLPLLWKIKYIFGEGVYRGALLTQAIIIMFYTYGRMEAFHRDLEEFYADVDSRFSSRCRMIRIAGYTLLVSVGLLFLFRFGFYSTGLWYFAVVDVLLTASLVVLTVCVLRQTVDAEKLKLMSEETRNMGMAVKSGASLRDRLDKVIAEEFYTEPDITIMSLADQLGTNRTYLSDLIHITYGMSFANFVNDLRIKKAIKEMREIPLSTPLTKVARMCGYTSYSQFAHTFEEFAHFTPSEWMKRYR